ncbi:uncharacterized protein LOC117152101 [Bombus impatiens]|uniref:Uncharacterized protein LOC117152101 n=1 Tax=Bombus impatiens TaxID=132113 RepID=A0A6P8LZD9_BOMIM|nr:uncharacterized protein LOC117152101 [Bombus impatiens]
MRGGEAELATEPTHVSTRSMRKAVSLKKGFFCSTLNGGNLRTDETTEEEETPAVEAPRATKRKASDSPELPTDLAEEMRTSTTADIGVELIRRASEVTKVADPASGTFAIMEGLIAALEAENEALRKELASRSTAEESSETARLVAIEC